MGDMHALGAKLARQALGQRADGKLTGGKRREPGGPAHRCGRARDDERGRAGGGRDRIEEGGKGELCEVEEAAADV